MHEELAALAAEYWDGAMARNPFVATLFGDHRFDDRVPDVSPSGLADLRAFAAGIASRAEAVDEGSLDAAGRVTRALLLDACRNRVEEVDTGEVELQSDGFTALPVALLRSASRLRAPDPASAAAQLGRLRQLPSVLDDVVAHWRAGAAKERVPAAAIVARTRAMVESHLAEPVDGDPFVSLALPDGWDGSDAWRRDAADVVRDHVRPAYQRVADALAELHARARDDDHAGLLHVPGGDDLYRSLARRATTTDLAPEEIHAIGMDELTDVLPPQWARTAERAFGASARDAVFDQLRFDPAMRYDTPDEILEHASTAIGRALTEAPRWFRRLPAAGVVVEPVPPSLAPGSPPAYYGAPPADGSRPGVYFANTHQPTRRNRFEAEVFAFHEAVPGHHLERASAVELGVPMFQRRGGSMAYSEGWGLYAERLADEMGLYSSDVMRLGMLSADAWRSARLVVDTGLHALGWTRTRAIEFMTTHVPIHEEEAAVEVDRYLGMPGQALSYKIGQRELLRLRDDAHARLGDRFDIAGFHHTVLEHGGVTLGILGDLVEDWVASTLAA